VSVLATHRPVDRHTSNVFYSAFPATVLSAIGGVIVTYMAVPDATFETNG
jgi:hypothetical protein